MANPLANPGYLPGIAPPQGPGPGVAADQQSRAHQDVVGTQTASVHHKQAFVPMLSPAFVNVTTKEGLEGSNSANGYEKNPP